MCVLIGTVHSESIHLSTFNPLLFCPYCAASGPEIKITQEHCKIIFSVACLNHNHHNRQSYNVIYSNACVQYVFTYCEDLIVVVQCRPSLAGIWRHCRLWFV